MTQPIIIQADVFSDYPKVTFGMSTRQGGVSGGSLGMNLSYNVGDIEENVRRNREIFFGALGINIVELALMGQTHSAIARVVDKPGTYRECDAMVTSVPRVFLCVSVADCVPIILFDRRRDVVAAIHAGWRGTVAGIAERALETMVRTFSTDPADVIGFVGPSAGPCCYEVGQEVAKRFDLEVVKKRDGKLLLDLKAANARQLVRAGVEAKNLEVSPDCTIHQAQRFHSHRRDNTKSGRMMATVGIAA